MLGLLECPLLVFSLKHAGFDICPSLSLRSSQFNSLLILQHWQHKDSLRYTLIYRKALQENTTKKTEKHADTNSQVVIEGGKDLAFLFIFFVLYFWDFWKLYI